VLVTGTDGVGTKLKLAIRYDRHDTVGQDLVAMCVNDILVTGAEPFLFLDYYATARLDVDVAERVITGIAAACELAGCTLAGGETAEMPGFYGDGDYDLAGFGIGVVERDAIVDGSALAPGQHLVALASSGPHSNGFSLINRILDEQGEMPGAELLDALLAPTRIYARAIAALQREVRITGMSHVTGGGILENVPRMFQDDRLGAVLDLDSWQRPALFGWLQQAGNVTEEEMLRTFNCGVGFVVCVDAADAERAVAILQAAGETAWLLGEIVTVAGAALRSGELLVHAGPAHRFG
jgi:phosphoribosylformylglycinamidine cyclo-ligase